MLLPSPTSWDRRLLASVLSFISFFQPQEHSWGIFTVQKLLPFNSSPYTHATQRDPACVKGFHMCFIRAALFQSSTLFNPKPSSFFRKTNLLPWHFDTSSAPFPQELIKFCSIALTNFFGKIKMLDQYICMSCTLPEKDRCLAVQDLIFAVIFSIKGIQSVNVSFPAMRGIPKYLTGSLPARNCRVDRICVWRPLGTAAQKLHSWTG